MTTFFKSRLGKQLIYNTTTHHDCESTLMCVDFKFYNNCRQFCPWRL